jgi:hypothetical protein
MLTLIALVLFSQNGYWPTGILDNQCPRQYKMTVEIGQHSYFLYCFGNKL